MLIAVVLALYALAVLGFIDAGLNDDICRPSEAVRVVFAALLWPLFHVQWRHSGQHYAGRVAVRARTVDLGMTALALDLGQVA